MTVIFHYSANSRQVFNRRGGTHGKADPVWRVVANLGKGGRNVGRYVVKNKWNVTFQEYNGRYVSKNMSRAQSIILQSTAIKSWDDAGPFPTGIRDGRPYVCRLRMVPPALWKRPNRSGPFRKRTLQSVCNPGHCLQHNFYGSFQFTLQRHEEWSTDDVI